MASFRLFGVLRRPFVQLNPFHKSIDPAIQLNIQLARANQASEILDALSSSSVTVSHKLFGLRVFSRLLKLNPKQRHVLTDERYRSLKTSVKEEISRLTAQELSDFLFWARVMKSLQCSELGKIEEEALVERVDFLSETDTLTSRQRISILFDLALLGRNSTHLERSINVIMSNPNEMVNLTELKQVLIAMTSSFRASSRILVQSSLKRLEEFGEERLDTKNAVEMLKVLSNLSKNNNSGKILKLTSKFTLVLRDRVSSFTEAEMLAVIDFYLQQPSANRMLLSSVFQRASAALVDSPSEVTAKFQVGLFRKLSTMGETGTLKFPAILRDSLYQSLADLIIANELAAESLASVIAAAPFIGKHLPEKLENALNDSLEHVQDGKLLPILKAYKGITMLNSSLDATRVLPTLEACKNKNIDGFHRIKLQCIEVMYSTRNFRDNDMLSSLYGTLCSQLKETIEGPFNSLRLYLNDRSKVGDSAAFSELDTLALTQMKNHWEDINPAYLLLKSTFLMNRKSDLWKSFVLQGASKLNSRIVDSVLRNAPAEFPLNSINFLLDQIEFTDQSLLLAIKRVREADHQSEIKELIRKLNQQDASIYYSGLFIDSLRPFSDQLSKRGLLKELSPLFSKINELLAGLEEGNLLSTKTLLTARLLSKLNLLSDELAERLVKAHSQGQIRDFYSFLVVAAQVPSAVPDKEELYSQIKNITRGLPINILGDRIIGYLSWPDEQLDEELLELIKNRLTFLTTTEAKDLVSWLSRLNANAYKQHKKFANTLIQIISEEISRFQGKLPLQVSLNLLKEFGKHQHLRIFNVYSSLLTDIMRGYWKMNSEQKISALQTLAKRGLRQIDLISEICNEATTRPTRFFGYFPQILSSVAELGCSEQDWAREALGTLIKVYMEKGISISQYSITNWLWGLVMFKAPDTAIAKAIEENNNIKKQLNFGFRDVLLNNHFKQNPSSVEYKTTITQEDIENITSPHRRFGIGLNAVDTLMNALKESGLEARQFVTNSGVWTPIYVPSKNLALWPLTNLVQTYNKEMLKGSMLMHYNQLARVSSKVITIDYKEMQTNVDDIVKQVNN